MAKTRFTVNVEFECNVPLKPVAVREYVETALKAEIGGRSVESPLKEIKRDTIRARLEKKSRVYDGG